MILVLRYIYLPGSNNSSHVDNSFASASPVSRWSTVRHLLFYAGPQTSLLLTQLQCYSRALTIFFQYYIYTYARSQHLQGPAGSYLSLPKEGLPCGIDE